MFQTTIANSASAEGVGLHTGVYGRIRLVPAPADTGIVFRRVDLDNFAIEAQGHNVARVSYATSLMKHGVLLSTTEHLLAAIYSCGIDNIYIDIDSIEVPILDGSAEPFMQMLEQAGTRRLRRKRRYLKVLKPLEVIEGDRRIGIYPADEFRVRCYVDFPHPLVGQPPTVRVGQSWPLPPGRVGDDGPVGGGRPIPHQHRSGHGATQSASAFASTPR